jgi:CDP-diacylglycerol--glycerol-3-phosphate 3-phosphatidyltransferase
VIAVLLAVLTETTGIVAVQLGASRNYKGPFGKSDRAVAFGLVSMLIGLGFPVGRWLDLVLAIMVVLLVMTILNRARAALDE